MTKPITQRVKSKISSLSDGVAFASNSFHFLNANKNSIEKELSNLTAQGIIRRFRRESTINPKKALSLAKCCQVLVLLQKQLQN